MGDDLFVILSVGFTLFCACGLINEFIKDFKHQIRTKPKTERQKVRPRRMPYTRFIDEVLKFSAPHLLSNSIKKYPRVKVIYRNHQRVRGRYRSEKKTIEVYVHPKIKLEQLVKTTLHEVRHYIQHKTDPDFQNYDYYTERHGYEQNPFEIDARSYASNYFGECLEYLKNKGWI
jgi:hypothetical protein